MNRTALCIRMLQILNSRDFITKKELADLLETNPRNVTEFLKELETVGYEIETTRGRYGGYHLKESALLPALRLTEEECESLDEAAKYLSSHADFLPLKGFMQVQEKIFSAQRQKNNASIVFLNAAVPTTGKMVPVIEMCRKACSAQKTVSFQYKSMHSKQFENVELQPYEVLNIQGEYYCLGYNRKKTSFRFYKFSNERMKYFEVNERSFQRDSNFNVHHYLGQSGLMKEECYEIECIIEGNLALLVSESGIGIHPVMKWLDDKKLHVSTLVEGKINALRLLSSLGDQCKLLAPESLKKEMHQIAIQMEKNYK